MLTLPMEFADAGREDTLTEDPPDLKLVRGGRTGTTGPSPAEGHRKAADAATDAASVINADVSILGEVRATGHIQVHGQVEGDIRCKGLLAGAKARITGAIVAEAVLVGGRVLGPIQAARVILKPTAHVQGDISCQWVKIEEGSYFDGQMRRVDAPRKAERPAEPKPVPAAEPTAKPAAEPTAKSEVTSITDLLQAQ